jgi:hypothetical protein
MSLLTPTAGQLIDRLAILRLKLVHATDPAQQTMFETEHDAIAQHLGPCVDEPYYQAALVHLQVVNAAIWDLQAQVAALVHQGVGPNPNTWAVDLFQLNQARVAAIAAIDQHAGAFVAPEKVGY